MYQRANQGTKNDLSQKLWNISLKKNRNYEETNHQRMLDGVNSVCTPTTILFKNTTESSTFWPFLSLATCIS